MRFGEITGHHKEMERLAAMADSGKVPHALLLHGPAGIGKMKVARAFVQYIFCTARQGGDSCGRCPACLQTAKLNNPDVHYVYPVVKNKGAKKAVASDYAEEWKDFMARSPYMSAEEWNRSIGEANSRPVIYVDESEEIIRTASLSAYGDGKKIFVVWLPEKMNVEAANKLLKIIEEPFEDTLFVFVSNNPGEIITTIRSRLQAVEFGPLPDSEVMDFLTSRGIDAAEAASLAKIARGNMNRAEALAKAGGELAEFAKDFIAVMRAAYARRMVELKDSAERFAAYGREKSLRLLDYFARMVRESFISNLQCAPLEAMTPAEKQFVVRFGPFINAANVEEMSAEIDRAREDISRNANQKIVWFDLMIELTRLIRTKGGIK